MLVNTSCVICLTVIFQLLFLYIKCLGNRRFQCCVYSICFDLVWCVNCQRNKKLVSGVNTVLLGSVTYNVDLKCCIVFMFCTKTSCFLYLHSLLSCQLWRWRGRNFESSCETSILEAVATKLRCANCSPQSRLQSNQGLSMYTSMFSSTSLTSCSSEDPLWLLGNKELNIREVVTVLFIV